VAVREFVVEIAERQMACGRRVRRRGLSGLILMSAFKAGEWRPFFEAVLAREAAGRGGEGDR
jgi:hypothetical protein